MATDWNKPSLTDEYSDFRDIVKEQLENLGTMTFTGDTNIPTGFIRRGTGDVLEKFTGVTWTATDREAAVTAHINDTSLHQGAPVGSIVAWLTASPPSGWFILDGVAKSRSTYAALFALWGTTYGSGDGVTTFGIPDMRARIPMGKGGASPSNGALGATFGELNHAHTGPSHTHTINGHHHSMQDHKHDGPSHTHTIPNHQHGIPAHYHSAAGSGADINITSGGSHHHGVPTRNNITGFSNSGTAFGKVTPAWAGAYDLNTEDTTHIHAHSEFAGRVGNVSSGNDGDGAFNTTVSGGGNTGSDGTGQTSGPSIANTDDVSLTTNSDGTGNTGTANPPCILVNWIVKGA